jgi:hypothetical protein
MRIIHSSNFNVYLVPLLKDLKFVGGWDSCIANHNKEIIHIENNVNMDDSYFFGYGIVFGYQHKRYKVCPLCRTCCHQKTGGIFFEVCTFPLLDIHGLKCISKAFIEV